MIPINAQTKVGLTHVGTALGGFIAAIAFMAQRKVDIYAIVDQINVVIAAITQLVAVVTPVATGAYAVYRASTRQRILDVVNDPQAADVARELPVTPQAIVLANAMKEVP